MSNTVKLQGISGQQKGTPTKDLRVGDIIIWNFGYRSEVVEITPSKTGKTITFMLKSFSDGIVRSRKMGADRLVVIEEKESEEPTNEVEKAIKSRKETYRGIYSDSGIVLDIEFCVLHSVHPLCTFVSYDLQICSVEIIAR